MLYSVYEMGHALSQGWRMSALGARAWANHPLNPLSSTLVGRSVAASAELVDRLTKRYDKPAWAIDSTEIDGKAVAVTPEVVWESPWVELVHFQRDLPKPRQTKSKKTETPKVLLVAPLSGHFATLLRGTVEAFLPDAEVYVSDWTDAKLVPVYEGRFDFHDYVDHVAEMIRQIGPCHVVAVCQPGPPVLAAASVMAEEKAPLRPLSLTFIGSPMDARRAPTVPNELAASRPFTWFKSNMIHTVPVPYPGAMRRVYPGFMQLAAFISMNHDRHMDAHYTYFEHLLEGDDDSAEKHRNFYDEYLSVLDLTEEFYLQTIDYVFQRHLLPEGQLMHRGRLIDPGAITDMAIMSVEGERDDIAGVGQCQAVHDLTPNLPQTLKTTLVQPGVGHYGIFTGSKFRRDVYPKILAHVMGAQTAKDRNASTTPKPKPKTKKAS